jgi:hypothetical protein
MHGQRVNSSSMPGVSFAQDSSVQPNGASLVQRSSTSVGGMS